jgi:cytoskeletal protein RodZ
MPEIGATLREARMRARIDISEIEAQTKIRAKYLRALENEEWDLLPGPTYVKSFLRTYADALHLDGKLLVEEYKLQFERLSDVELQPITPGGSRARAPAPRVSRLWWVAAGIVVVLAAIYALGGGWWSGDGTETPAASTTTTATTQATTTPASKKRKRSTAATVVRLQIVPTAPVYVCLESAGGKALVNGETLTADSPSRTFRSKRFRIGLGNGSVVLRVNGKPFDVPESSNPIGYELTPKGRRTLPESQRPTCAPA